MEENWNVMRPVSDSIFDTLFVAISSLCDSTSESHKYGDGQIYGFFKTDKFNGNTYIIEYSVFPYNFVESDSCRQVFIFNPKKDSYEVFTDEGGVVSVNDVHIGEVINIDIDGNSFFLNKFDEVTHGYIKAILVE